jgi:pimeloyl-ACP methyl ester carboxylesterase
MHLLAELLALGTAAVRLPGTLRRSGCTARSCGPASGEHWPVVLVHGYAGSDVVWDPLRRVLAASRFDRVLTVSYDSFGVAVDEVTACIAGAVREATAAHAPGVHLVGHSLGGLLLRRAVADHDLSALVGAAVTISTPHGGSPLARFAVGDCARLLAPAPVPARTPSGPGTGPRWLRFASDGDRVVPPSSALLPDPELGTRTVLVRGPGHLTVCRDPHLLRTLVDHLAGAERPAAPAALAA